MSFKSEQSDWGFSKQPARIKQESDILGISMDTTVSAMVTILQKHKCTTVVNMFQDKTSCLEQSIG